MKSTTKVERSKQLEWEGMNRVGKVVAGLQIGFLVVFFFTNNENFDFFFSCLMSEQVE